MRGHVPVVIGVTLGATVLAWAGWRVADAWRFEAGVETASRKVDSGQFDDARRILAGLAASRPGRADVSLLLGVCERSLGRPEAAEAAWSRVSPVAPEARRASLLRAGVLLEDLGRFAEAETLLGRIVRSGGAPATEARPRLAQLLYWEGRAGATRALIIRGWATNPDRVSALRDLWSIDSDPTTRERTRELLEKASARAPEDDRVWLGLANLETRSGRFEEARRRLDACLERRPDDPAVWRARLDWAEAAGRADEAARAIRHLPAGHLTSADAFRLRAWFAALRNDRPVERRALETLLTLDPAAPQALERLAVLAAQAGETRPVAEFARRKSERDEARSRFDRLLGAPAPTGRQHAAELARLAETLGRWFEAREWWALADVPFSEREAAYQRIDPLLSRADAPAESSVLDSLTDEGSRFTLSPVSSSPVLPPEFEDRAENAGLRFVYRSGRSPSAHLPETMGGGVGLIDYDGDGRLDVYCVQGGTFPPPTPGAQGDRLFRNTRDGTFEDVTERSGIGRLPGGYGHGVAVGDVDNDGWPDLFITRWRQYALYRNKGDGTFEDATGRWGLAGDRDWPTSAAFADFDGDGDLDLYVCHYLEWDPEHPPPCAASPAGPRTYCDPHILRARPDHLFRNDGGRFVDVSAEAGIVDRDGRGLGVVAVDLDGDDDLDIFVANDTTANYLFRNLGGMKFEEVGHEAGVASSANGGYQAGMGVAAGDLDNDGRPDLVVTNFYGESTTLYHNLGRGLFTDNTTAIGLAAPSRYLLGFGVTFCDVNNDGRLDLASNNGHVNDFRPQIPYAMPAQLLTGTPSGRLVVASDSSPWTTPRVGRGFAAGDLDHDGRIDLVLVAQDQPLAYLHNRTRGGSAVSFRLRGSPSNRDAVGARVTVTAGGRTQSAWRFGGGSYLSASDPRVHFGLGDCARLEEVEVRWPSGRIDRHRDLPTGRSYEIPEGEPPRPQ